MKSLPMKRILSYVKPHAVYLAISLVCSLLYAVGALVIPVFVGRAIDGMIGPGDVDFSSLMQNISCIGGLAAVILVAGLGQGIANNRLAFLTVRDLRNAVIEKMQRLPLSYFDTVPSGNVVDNMISDAEALSDGVLLGFTQLFTGGITILGTLVMMIVYNPLIAAVVAVLTPLSLFTARFISKKTHEKFVKQAEIRAEQTTFTEEIVTNHKTIKSYGQEQATEQKFAAVNEELRKTSLLATFFSSLPNPTTRFVNSLVYTSVTLVGGLCAAGVWHIGATLTAGVLASLLAYAGQFAKPFNEISGVVTELQASAVGAKRIFNLLDEEEETADGTLQLSGNGKVDVEHVDFSYVPSRPLIRDLSLHVEPGKHIAIVGKTGCGKTTLINLLMRFYDVDQGAIRIDGIDVRDLSRSALRDNYGMVLQESWIRRATVRDNLTLGAQISDDEIIKSAILCKSDAFISRLKDGYDTMLSEESLSQGERQLLCITRVMLSKPKMLILDEATSAVDLRTEVSINDAFDLLMKDKTSFIVAHRLSTIKNADCILVMDNGNVVEQGTHEELLQKSGVYATLYRQ